MKKSSIKKQILSAIAVLTISATTIGGAVSIAGCSEKSSNLSKQDLSNATVISTAKYGDVYSVSSGTTYYVAPDGSSSNDGSESSPKNISLLSSLDALKPGDTVLLKPGVYKVGEIDPNERVYMTVSGEYNKYISIKNADPTKQCVIDFSAQEFNSLNRGVTINGDYVYWYGIDVCGAGDNGLYIGGSYNTVENCEFYNNRDTGLQLGRGDGSYSTIDKWPSYNLVKNCTSHNNYDNETYGENADGFAAKLTVGYGNVFDGCIAYRNSDDGWDLYAKTDSGNIGTIIMYNCVAYENGYLEYTQRENNARYSRWKPQYSEDAENGMGKDSYLTRDGDGNGFKLGGSVMEGDVLLYNCLSFNNRMHGVTDNSNPGVISIDMVTSYNNSAMVDDNPESDYFGYILDVPNADTHANIDLSRQVYSYNNVSRTLSVSDNLALSLSADAYRGSVVDSILLAKKIDGSIDGDTKNPDGETGATQRPYASTEIFTKLPFTKSVDSTTQEATYTFNVKGLNDLYADSSETALNPNRAHVIYRNSDSSINMGEILAVKDYTKLLGDSKKIGSILNLSKYEDYTHFYVNDVANINAASKEASIVERTKESLTLNCDTDAVYQDFDIPTKMITCDIEWSSSDASLLKINTAKKQISTSKSEYIMAEVYRPMDNDAKVTITATITCGSVSDTKSFELTIKAGKPKLGEIYARTMNGQYLYENDVLILDHYTIYTEPEILVQNGLDYNGKLLSGDLYDVTTTYMFTSDKAINSVPVANFTPSNAGVYTVTKTVTLKSDSSQSKSMSYYVYVASPYGDIDFMENTASLVVNRYGYIISGETTNATGIIYAISSDTALDLNEDNKASIKTMSGVQSYNFRGDTISFQFDNQNSGAYHIYYLLANLNGDVKSPLYTVDVSVVNISTCEDFMKIAQGKALNDESTANTIYQLTSDLDFTGKAWTVGTESFVGLLNGNGHTIKNLLIDKQVGIFYRVAGGTLMNVKFDNINISSNATKSAIVSECTGGYFYNIQIHDINVVSTNQRAGGLIGHINVGTPVEIEQVSVVNDNENYKIKGQQRVGGIVAFSQAGSNYTSGKIDVSIKDCHVNAVIEGDYELGGIYGNYDCGNNKNCTYNLQMDHCVFTGKVISVGAKSYAGGILGYQKGAYSVMKIQNCISVGEIQFAGEVLLTSLKNSSGIVGSSTTVMEGLKAEVVSCYALMEEFNSNFDVLTWTSATKLIEANYKNAGLDESKWDMVIDETKEPDRFGNRLKAPYVSLKFLGNWN